MIIRTILGADNPKLRERMHALIARRDVLVDTVATKDELWEQAARESYDLIFVRPSLLPAPTTESIMSLRNLPDSPEVVAICDEENPEMRARFLAAGCMSVLYSGLPKRELSDAVRALLNRRRELVEKSLADHADLGSPQLSDFVSSSPAMQAFMNVVRRVVATDTSLLITGETGVGKERLARAIHSESPRARGPFISVNCGALPDALLESELFGHEEGAFTGAVRSRRGWFELAHGGTIFLDEVGEMPLHLQVKLLHVLQSHEVQRVGGETPLKIDVRVMAATNRDLTAEVEAGRFRRDLYFRLGVVALGIPPLRERREDIPALVESYLGYFRAQIPNAIEGLSKEALDALVEYPWPGNVRELINIIERAMLLCDRERIDLDDLPETLRSPNPAQRVPALLDVPNGATLPADWTTRPLRHVRRAVVAEVERAYLAGLLAETGGRIGETARRAGIQPRSLYEKMRRYKLQKEDYR